MQDVVYQESLFDQDTWSGKMCQAHCQAGSQKEKTSGSSSKKSLKSSSRKPMCLCLKKTNGPIQASYWEMDGALLGEFSMHSFGEHPISLYHNGVGESRLSQILEVNPHQRYCLSAKACQGILNRANRRGKKLPEMLEMALMQQAGLSKAQ